MRIPNDGITVCVRKKPADSDIVYIDGTSITVNETKTRLDGIGKYNEVHRFQFDRVYDEVINNRQVTLIRISLNRSMTKLSRVWWITLVRVANQCALRMVKQDPARHTPCFILVTVIISILLLQQGICYIGMEDLLHSAQDLHLKMSFYEIYRGNLFDLLGTTRRRVMACEDTDKSIKILKLTELEIQTRHQAREALAKALELRSTGSTGANMQSSRSHAILQFTLYKPETKKGTTEP